MRAIEKAEVLYANPASFRLTFAERDSQPAPTVSDRILPLHQRITAVWAIHVTVAPEELGGWFYGRCACGARSLPLSTEAQARDFKCYVGDAEETRVIADNFYHQRVADAHLVAR